MSNSKRGGLCRIIGAGEFSPSDITDFCDAFYIAADGGLEKLDALGLEPSLTVGDFDSLGYTPSGQNVSVFPSEKDDTDTGIAVKRAIALGFDTIELYGALGGRLDHTLANIQLLSLISESGRRGRIIGNGVIITAVTDSSLEFPAGTRGTVSVFALGGIAHGVYLTGLKYPLVNATLTCDFPLGVSNEFTGAASKITVEHGTLTVITLNGE